MPEFTDLIDHLTERTQREPALVQTMVELTYGCNLRCVHCYNPTHSARNELSTSKVLHVLDQLAQEGCLWIGFTGGEIFTRTDACDIMDYARSKGMMISVITNATLITPVLADRLQQLSPYQVDVSLYGATTSTYEKVTRIRGSFDAFKRGLDLLQERSLPILLKLVMMTLNVDELDLMKQFAENRELPHKVGTEIHPRVDGNLKPLEYRLSPQQVFSLWERNPEFAGLQESEPACGNHGQLFECLCGKSNAAITPHGKMNLCVSIYTPQYDLNQGSVTQGWKTLTRMVKETKPGPEYECHRCPINQACTRGSMDGWLERGQFDAPCLPYFRELAEKKSTLMI